MAETSLLSNIDDEDVMTQEKFDKRYGARHVKPGYRELFLEFLMRFQVHKSSYWLAWLPIVGHVRAYNWRQDPITDFMAGLTIGIMNIPMGLAYGMLAGLQPINGLYTSFFAPLIYAFFGSSKHVSFGTFAVISLMVSAVIDREMQRETTIAGNASESLHSCDVAIGKVRDPFFNCAAPKAGVDAPERDWARANEVSVALTLSVGIVQIVLGIMNLGFVSVYLSDQLVQGLTTAASVHVLTSQLTHVFGISGLPSASSVLGLVKYYGCLFGRLGDTNMMALVGAVVCMVLIVAVKECLDPITKPKIRVPLPVELLVIVLATVVSSVGEFELRRKIKVVGLIPNGLAAPIMPDLSLFPLLAADAVVIGVVVFSIDVSMAKLFAKTHGYKIEPNQEWFALGLAHLGSSFFSCHCAGSSLSRSSVVAGQGAASQVFTLISCVVILCTLLFLAPLFQMLPNFALAAIIIVALKNMFLQVKGLPGLFRVSKTDFWIWMVTFWAVILLDVTYGLVAGVTFALATVIYRAQRPNSVCLGEVGDTGLYKGLEAYSNVLEIPGLKIFRFDSPLFFANVERFQDELVRKTGVDVSLIAAAQRKQRAATPVANPPKADDGLETGSARQLSLEHVDVEKREDLDLMATVRRVQVRVQRLMCVVLDCSTFSYLDVMGQDALATVYTEHREAGIKVFFAAAKVHVRRFLERGDFYKRVPRSAFFVTVHEAVLAAKGYQDDDTDSSTYIEIK